MGYIIMLSYANVRTIKLENGCAFGMLRRDML